MMKNKLVFKVHKQIYMPFTLSYHTLSAAAANGQSTQKLAPDLQDSAERRENQLGVTYMKRIRPQVDSNACFLFLQVCTNVSSLKQLHTHIHMSGLEHNLFIGTKLVSLYAMLGCLSDARLLFNRLFVFERTAFLWNVMIKGYVYNGLCGEALALYNKMQHVDILPDNFTFSVLLKACASLSAFQEGKGIHYRLIVIGLELDAFVGSALVDMYAKCGSIEDARQVFDKMSSRDTVSWNSMIAGYAHNGLLEEALGLCCQMRLEGAEPDRVTVVSVLSVCANLRALDHGEEIHGYAIKSGLELHVSVGNVLIDMYAKCGSVAAACNVFDKIYERDEVSWNTMILGYVQKGHVNEGLKLFNQMQFGNMKPNSVTMVSMLPAFADIGVLEQGKCIHSYIVKNGLEMDVSVGTALVDMYAKCGGIKIASLVFEKTTEKDVVSWNAMISGHILNGCADEALEIFHQMQMADVKPDSATLVSVLSACGRLRALHQGKWIHAYIIRSGLELDVSIGNSLVAMYAKCGHVDIAQQLFDVLSQRDLVTWNAIIAGHVQNGHAKEALELFHQMQLVDMKPNSVTMLSVLPACADLASLQQGNWIHNLIIRSGLEADVSVVTALVDMYAKCGNIDAAGQLFDRMTKQDVISWSTMIAGYGMHGLYKDALRLFGQMQQAGMKPDHITFIGVLSACTHAGLVDEGWRYFNCMSGDFSLTPRVEHYACMVDLLGRAGRLDEAENIIKHMPIEPDSEVWGTLLAACKAHCNVELAERVSKNLLELEPENAGIYVLLANIYAVAGRWENVRKVRAMLKDNRLKKNPGCSWIEIKNRVHAFIVRD
jgi:pentatricopeptide repeat protein